MKLILGTILICVLFDIFSSCVVIYPQKSNLPDAQEKKLDSLELLLARFPVLSEANSQNNSLYVTVIDNKKRLTAEIELIDDSASYIDNVDTIRFKLNIRDFDKTINLSSIISCPSFLFKTLNFEKTVNDYYRIVSQNYYDNPQSCLVKNIEIKSDDSRVFYFYAGELINTKGNEVFFYAQTDVIAVKIMYGAIIISSNFMDGANAIVDLCKYKVDEEKKKAKCNKPTLNVTFYFKPLAEVFNIPIMANFYKDCSIKIICNK